MTVRSFWRNALLLAGGVLALSGCSPKEHDAVVASVANEPITLSEYERQYLRNTPNRDSAAALPLEAKQRFLDLMVNYKLKLTDARRENLEQQPQVRNEIQQYKGGLAASYVTDREIVGPALRRLYQRRGEEIRLFATGATEGEKTITVPVRFRNLAPRLAVATKVPTAVELRIAGPKIRLMRLGSESLMVSLDLQGVGEGDVVALRLEAGETVPQDREQRLRGGKHHQGVVVCPVEGGVQGVDEALPDVLVLGVEADAGDAPAQPAPLPRLRRPAGGGVAPHTAGPG